MGLIVHEFKVSFKFPSITVGEVAAFAKHTLKSGTDVNLLFEEITTSTGAEAMQMAIFEHAIADVGKRFIAPTLLSLRLLQYCLDNIERRSIICTPINNFIKKFPSTFTLTAQLATPKSTGEVRLGRNGKLEVSPGYLTNADDIEAIGFALRTAYNVTSGITGPSAPAKLLVPSFMLDSASLSDKEIGEKAKSVIISPHHFAGTASVGKVVDSNLKVIGVNGLYVADASALPRTTRVNSMASAMMIGRLAGINFT
jgi:GMC oxidoreductase